MKTYGIPAYAVNRELHHGKPVDFSVITKISPNQVITSRTGLGVLEVEEQNGQGIIKIFSRDRKNPQRSCTHILNLSQADKLQSDQRGGFILR